MEKNKNKTSLLSSIVNFLKDKNSDLIERYVKKNPHEKVLYSYNSEMIINERIVIGTLIATENGITFVSMNENDLVEDSVKWKNIIGYTCDSLLQIYTKNADRYIFKGPKGNELREIIVRYV